MFGVIEMSIVVGDGSRAVLMGIKRQRWILRKDRIGGLKIDMARNPTDHAVAGGDSVRIQTR